MLGTETKIGQHLLVLKDGAPNWLVRVRRKLQAVKPYEASRHVLKDEVAMAREDDRVVFSRQVDQHGVDLVFGLVDLAGAELKLVENLLETVDGQIGQVIQLAQIALAQASESSSGAALHVSGLADHFAILLAPSRPLEDHVKRVVALPQTLQQIPVEPGQLGHARSILVHGGPLKQIPLCEPVELVGGVENESLAGDFSLSAPSPFVPYDNTHSACHSHGLKATS